MPNLMHVIPRPGQNTAAPIIELPPTVYIFDDFERPNTTAADGLGGDWVVPVQSWSVTGGAAQYGGATPAKLALIDAGVTDYTLRMTMAGSASVNPIGIVFRCADSAGSNYLTIWRANPGGTGFVCRYLSFTDGTATELASWTGVSAGTQYDATMEVTVNGSDGTFTFGGSRTFTLPAGYDAGTWVGFTGYSNQTNPYRVLEFGAYSH